MVYSLAALVVLEEVVKMSGVVKLARGLAEDGAEEVVGRGRERLVQLCQEPPTS